MKNIYEVLRQKEATIERLKKELQALHLVAPLLQEDTSEEHIEVPAPPIQPHRSEGQPTLVAKEAASKPAWP